MRVPAVRRAVASLLAVWFALVSVDPAWLHACPMHGAPQAASHGTASMSMEHHGHGSMTVDQPADDAGHHCACLGDCSAGTATPLLRRAPAVPVAEFVAVTTTAAAQPHALRAARKAFVLPFATAPPHLTA